MNQIIDILVEYLPAIITGTLSLVAAITAFVTYNIQSRKIKALQKALDEAKARETFTICPGCKKKIRLADLTFYLPDGSTDNDLDGKAD